MILRAAFRTVVLALCLVSGQTVALAADFFPWGFIHTASGKEVISAAEARNDYNLAIGAAGITAAMSPWEKDVCGNPMLFGYSETKGYVDRSFTTSLDLSGKDYGIILAMFADDKATISIYELDGSDRPGASPVHTFRVAGGAAWNPASYKADNFVLAAGKKYKLALAYRNNLHWNDNRIPGKEDVDGVSVYKIAVKVNVSAYSTQEPCFGGYAAQCTPGKTYSFGTGKDFIQGLIEMTTTYGFVGDIHVFSHAWLYQSASGIAHNGGFYGAGPNNSGFYGSASPGDHVDSRTLADLQNVINFGSVKLCLGGKIFLEGCHIGEIGTFVTQLATITGRPVISACGASSEQIDVAGKIYFNSGAENQAELTDPDYDGWLKNGVQIGANYYAW